MQEIIVHLRNAKMSHKRWVSHASALIEGIPVDKNQVPINYTMCDFGKWYYGEGQKLSEIQEFIEIEQPHEELHGIYTHIFKILFLEDKPSFFSRLIGKASQLSPKNKAKARSLFIKLDTVSKQIVEKLDALEKKVKAMPVEVFEKL